MIRSRHNCLVATRRAITCLFVAWACLVAGCGGFGGGPDALLDELARAKQPGFVFDFASVINSADRAAIERTLGALEAQTTADVKVVTIPSLRGGQIDDFANRLFERWGIGKKEKDNGILLLAAIEDRKVRIEVGYGLEPTLPDAATGRLLDAAVLPAFRRGDYSGGLRAGAEAIAAKLGGRTAAPLSVPGARAAPPAGPFENIFRIILMIIVLIFVIRHPFLALMLLGGGRGGRSGGGFGGFGGGGFGGGLSGGGGASRGW